jgi:hypothetical protein
MLRYGRALVLFGLLFLVIMPSFADATAQGAGTTLILADPTDPYYPLAGEIARTEDLNVVHTVDEVLAQQPTFLLWVVSPDRLSDRVMVDFGLAVRGLPRAISTGIISGATLQDARALWQRAASVEGERVVAANAANPAGNIEAGIAELADEGTKHYPLTKANLIQSLQRASYLTFTGHGSGGYLRLDDETTLRAGDLPALPPLVVATGSCNTFRPWERDSIALAFAQHGSAAYAGFAYSPNEGYLMGSFEGLPFRYTWPDFPIGHAVQAQNRGTLQGFASLPYYYLLGDPRISLQAKAPYELVGVEEDKGGQIRYYAGAPRRVIPVRVPGGARYAFVEVPGVGMAWRGEPFFNARLQAVDIGEDKLVLLEHQGGDFSLNLRVRPPWLRVAADIVLDALDGTLLFLQDNGGSVVMLMAGALAAVAAALMLLRHKASSRALLPAALTGLVLAVLHGLYALARLDRLSVTSKGVDFGLLSLAATFLLVTCGAFFYLHASSWRGRAVALGVATLSALAPAVLLLLLLGVADELLMGQRLGAGLWNCRLGLQPLIVFTLATVVLGPLFYVMRKAYSARNQTKEDIAHA